MDGALVGSEYASHLTDADLRLLASVARGPEDASWLRGDPGALVGLLGDPRVFEAVFGPGDNFGEASGGGAIPAAPLLSFAVGGHPAPAQPGPLAPSSVGARGTTPRRACRPWTPRTTLPA